MDKKPNIKALKEKAALKDRYRKQLNRVKANGEQTDCIDEAVTAVTDTLPKTASTSLVVYGDPQSGKTEMMICLTAKLLDLGYSLIVHLLNDSLDLLVQNLERFKLAGLAPAPRNSSELTSSPLAPGQSAVLFCKKNAKDLQKLIAALGKAGPVVVIDDEADYATPNAKVNQNEKTRINELVTALVGTKGHYIGVTATPARLNLNNTLDNKTEMWVQFRPHDAYTGQEVFFPQDGKFLYRLSLLDTSGTPADANRAFARFLVTVAYLNTTATIDGKPEQNYTMLVHTSGKTADHTADRQLFEGALTTLISQTGTAFNNLIETVYEQAKILYPSADPDELTAYVIQNASRSSIVVLNSKRDRAAAGDKPTVPTTPFTVIIGGNIVSRGVTFPNLLSMYFTRDVQTRLQQDTYIQRARMFGARGKYLKHFELTIPRRLYGDWSRCFVFHRLALQAIKNNNVSPVWLGDPRISIASASSIDRATVDLAKGEMSFQIFPFADFAKLDAIVDKAPTELATLKKIADEIGDAMPRFLIDYLDTELKRIPGSLAIHPAGSVAGYKDPKEVEQIARTKGFMGNPQLELTKFPNALHHIKIFHNGKGKARVFYRNQGGVQFVQNLKK